MSSIRHLYIHVPFCQRRCSYCDFNTYANLEHRIEAYVDALCAELSLRAREHRGVGARERKHASSLAPHISDSPAQLTRASLAPTIFLGGGTPTMLSLAQIERVLRAADAIVPLDGAEVTTEANPGTVIDESYLRGLRSLGINRISFGVQTFHDPSLRVLGRIHTAAEAIATYRQAQRAGFDRINLDFIFGLPGQTLEQWQHTLDRLAELQPEHVSLYSLILEAGTPLHRQVTTGSISVPDDDATAAMYELAMERLAAAGYDQYEISNWALPGTGTPESSISPMHPGTQTPVLPAGACHHNVAYWLNADYIGAGAGAHGHIYPRRWHDILGVDDYIAASRAGRLPEAESIDLTADDLFEETMMMGLRLTAGVSHAHFRDRCGAELPAVYGDTIDALVSLGLLESDAVGIRLTPRGRMLGNEVFARFLRDRDVADVAPRA
jgi:oxygen-independent coproporphyrinogen III oxidase